MGYNVSQATTDSIGAKEMSQGPWYENTSSKLSIISPSGWVQFRVTDVEEWEIAAVTVGVDGAETRKSF